MLPVSATGGDAADLYDDVTRFGEPWTAALQPLRTPIGAPADAEKMARRVRHLLATLVGRTPPPP